MIHTDYMTFEDDGIGNSKSSHAMLKRSSGNPLEQSRLLKRYLEAKDSQKLKLVRLCDEDTLTLVRRFDPQILEGLV